MVPTFYFPLAASEFKKVLKSLWVATSEHLYLSVINELALLDLSSLVVPDTRHPRWKCHNGSRVDPKTMELQTWKLMLTAIIPPQRPAF
jgi:hypothetical protein